MTMDHILYKLSVHMRIDTCWYKLSFVSIVITVGHACLHLFTPALGSLSLAEQNLVTNFNGEL